MCHRPRQRPQFRRRLGSAGRPTPAVGTAWKERGLPLSASKRRGPLPGRREIAGPADVGNAVIMNGLPPHIAQVICGHKRIDTALPSTPAVDRDLHA